MILDKEEKFLEPEVDSFLYFARNKKNLDISVYRRTFLKRRLRIRLDALRMDNLLDYIQFIKNDSGEWDIFLDTLSINVSKFFRDPEVFREFQDICIPELIARKQRGKARFIKSWSCGCSDGEEPYSLAITFKEYLRKKRIEKFIVRIWATDVDEDALRKARKGEYPKASLKNVNGDILQKYFISLPGNFYRVKDEIKSMVTFKKHNLFTGSPLKFADVVFFRNVRIYFGAKEGKKIFFNIANSLKKEGYFVSGKTENIAFFPSHLFKMVSLSNKIAKKV